MNKRRVAKLGLAVHATLATVAALALLISLIAASTVVVPILIRDQIQFALKRGCETCKFTVGDIRFSPLSRTITFKKPRLSAGDPGPTPVTAQAESIAATFSPISLLLGVLHLKQVNLQNPDVTVTERDSPAHHASQEPDSSAPRWNVVIGAIQITEGRFVYRRIRGRREAPIRVNDIQGTVGLFGSTPSLRDQPAIAQATGRLENSGHFTFKLTTLIFSKSPHADVEIRMTDQNLADMNPFFQNEHGITLTGNLYRGHSMLNLRGPVINAWVQAKYRRLDIHFKKSRENSEFTAMIANLVKSIQLDPSSIGEAPRDQVRGIRIERKKGEYIMQFIVRAMKDAALKLSTS